MNATAGRVLACLRFTRLARLSQPKTPKVQTSRRLERLVSLSRLSRGSPHRKVHMPQPRNSKGSGAMCKLSMKLLRPLPERQYHRCIWRHLLLHQRGQA